jgi:hypothetical protein
MLLTNCYNMFWTDCFLDMGQVILLFVKSYCYYLKVGQGAWMLKYDKLLELNDKF